MWKCLTKTLKQGGKPPSVCQKWKEVLKIKKESSRIIKKPRKTRKKKEEKFKEDQKTGNRLIEWFAKKEEIPRSETKDEMGTVKKIKKKLGIMDETETEKDLTDIKKKKSKEDFKKTRAIFEIKKEKKNTVSIPKQTKKDDSWIVVEKRGKERRDEIKQEIEITIGPPHHSKQKKPKNNYSQNSDGGMRKFGQNGRILGTELDGRKKLGYFRPKSDKIRELGLKYEAQSEFKLEPKGIQPMGSKGKEETADNGQGTPMGIHHQHLGSKDEKLI